MRYNNWVFLFLLATLGRLFAEDKLCDIPNIENGQIAQYYYSFKNYYFPMKRNEKLLYSCLPGYTTASGSKDARVNCTIRGWVPAPKCYKKCPKPPLDNGVFFNMGLSYKIWERLQYRCNPGFQSPGGNRDETIQCLQEGWSTQPQCIEATTAPAESGCSLTRVLEHGGVLPRKESYEEGDVVQFFCLEGYSLKGSELIQCYYFGWYPEPPICEERTNKCPPPPQPPHTKLLNNLRTYHHGDILHLECEHPFQIQGTADIHCENGKWTSPPKCVDVGMAANIDSHRSLNIIGNCSSPPVVKSSSILNNVNPLLTSFQMGSIVEYRCNPYHLMKGPNTVHCVQGNWTEPPVCLEPCLIDEELFANYNIEMKWRLEGKMYFLHGDIIEFSCKQGYVLAPFIQELQLLVQCNDGKLKYPKCISKDLDEHCRTPPSIKNGAIVDLVTTDYTHGSTVEYRCHEYHVLQGSMKISCSRGQWSVPPICIEPCTLSTAEMVNNNLGLQWSFDNRPYFLHGEYIEFVCRPYHFPAPSSSSSDFRVPCQHGQILYPQCTGASR